MSAREQLAESRIFNFAECEYSLNEFVQPYRYQGYGDEDTNGLLDLVALAAAEFSLLRTFETEGPGRLELPLAEPIYPSPSDAGAAFLQADCSIYNPVHWRKAPEEVTVADVLMFAGDMTKLGIVTSGEVFGRPQPVWDNLPTFVVEVELLYQQSAHPLGLRVGESGLVRLQGLIWTTRYALVTNQASVEDAVIGGSRWLGIVEDAPAGAGA